MYERNGVDAVHSAEQALRCVQGFVCGGSDLSNVSSDQLYYLLGLILRDLDEALAKLGAK